MTKELYNNLQRAFVTDCPPTHAVGITADERVYVVARIYESYCPNMTPPNRGYCGTVIGEMIDRGSYCVLDFVANYRTLTEAQTAFRKMAREQGMSYAGNDKELKRLLKKVAVEERQSA